MEHSGDSRTRPQPRPFQFRLIELFLFITVFAVVFSMLKWWGVRGFVGVGTFAAGLAAIVLGIDYAIKKNLGW